MLSQVSHTLNLYKNKLHSGSKPLSLPFAVVRSVANQLQLNDEMYPGFWADKLETYATTGDLACKQRLEAAITSGSLSKAMQDKFLATQPIIQTCATFGGQVFSIPGQY